ncbi:MAG: uL13 family ribosomal protein, partial [Acidobacteriia bacterium]|nr:uL13 family ribosomal protein [Terriglobia bacterium]
MSTEFPSKNAVTRNWHVIDAQNVVLGKLASKAAMLLMGKTKASYTPFLDTGDHVIVINAEKVRLT